MPKLVFITDGDSSKKERKNNLGTNQVRWINVYVLYMSITGHQNGTIIYDSVFYWTAYFDIMYDKN